MEAIGDLSWLRLFSLFPVERFDLHGFGIAVVSVPPTPAHHEERFRHRLLAFDPHIGKPVLSVDLEKDILGDFCLSIQVGKEHHVLARYDAPPALAEFRARAIAEAETALPDSPLPISHGQARKRRR